MSLNRSDETSSDERAAANEPLLRVEDLARYFDESEGFIDRLLGGGGKVKAVDGVDLELEHGETLAVVGESGCGKSTLGRTILKLHDPTDGRVQFNGEDITDLSEDEMRPYRSDMQVVFQDSLAALNSRKTVGDIIKTPLKIHDIGDTEEERTERAEDLMTEVGLKPGHLDRYPGQFSGGQQKRIDIARAMSVEPELIVADEPTSSLDVSVQAQILNLFEELQEEFGLTMIFITHDLSVVRQIADRVAVMYLGEIVETSPVETLFENPQHPYTRSLLSAVPRIDPESQTERIILEGVVPSPIDPPSGCRFHTRCPVVVPPEEWSGDREAFQAGFTFRNRLLADEFDPGAIRTRLSAEGEPATDAAVIDAVLENQLPCDLSALPDSAANAVREAVELYVDGDTEEAKSTIEEVFHSPCESETPARLQTETEHAVACHRYDDEIQGEPTWPHSTVLFE